MNLAIEDVSSGLKLSIKPDPQPRENWLPYDFSLPWSWQGRTVRLLAEDRNVSAGGWLGFSEPLTATGPVLRLSAAFTLLSKTVFHFVLLMIPALAGCAFAIRKGIRDIVFAGLVFLAATGAAGYLAFWLWFFSPKVGAIFSVMLPLAGLIFLVQTWRKLDPDGRRVLNALLVPISLAGAVTLLVLSFGFLYGGLQDPLITATVRFSHRLPADNSLPYLFAEGVRAGHVPKPMYGEWLSSDRPPLQTGIALSQYPFSHRPRLLDYMVVSAIAQSLWLFALWLVLTAFRLDAHLIALVLFVCVFSGFVLVNTFYVWPKLLAAAYMLGLFLILLTKHGSKLLGESKFLAVIAGALGAFGILAHGGSAFALIGSAATLVVIKRALPRRPFITIAAAIFVLYLPWTLYQKFFDPPGDRLLTWHLAGAGLVHPSKTSFGRAILSSYRHLTYRAWLNSKLGNCETLFGYGPVAPGVKGEKNYWEDVFAILTGWQSNPARAALTAERARFFRSACFLFIVQDLGFLIVGPLALLLGLRKRNRSDLWYSAASMWLFVALTLFTWCLLMFLPSSTVLHQGTYVLPLLAAAGSIVAVWAVAPWLARLICSLQVILNALAYGILMRQPGLDGVLANEPVNSGMVVLALFSLLLVSALLWKLTSLDDLETLEGYAEGKVRGTRSAFAQ